MCDRFQYLKIPDGFIGLCPIYITDYLSMGVCLEISLIEGNLSYKKFKSTDLHVQ